MDIKDKVLNNNTNINKYGIFNIDGYNEKGVAVGNKLGLFDDKEILDDYCMYILRNLEHEETILKIMVVDFEAQKQIPFLLYCYKNQIQKILDNK